MPFSLAPFAFSLLQALDIHAKVMARDGLNVRTAFVSKAIAARLRTGIRALEAFLRRVLILMALDIEHELVAAERPENLARAKARMPIMRHYSLRIYPAFIPIGKADPGHGFFDRCAYANPPVQHQHSATLPPVTVPINHLFARLDHLHALAKAPLVKARRLAFSLARSRHGILMAPDEHPRLLRRWGTEACAIYDAMASQIMVKSRSRPPHLPPPPPRRGPVPMITVFW